MAIDKDQLQTHLEKNQPKALDILQQMVAVNSFTHHAAGVNKVGDLTAALFEPMGFTAQRPQAVECLVSSKKPLGKHLLLTRPGNTSKKIGLVGHLDTVFTKEDEQENDFHWRVCGERIYGPGTSDIKGGNVQIWLVLQAIQQLAPRLFDQVNWVVMFNAAEEGLASDFGAIERRLLGPDALANLIFESVSLEEGIYQMIRSRKGRCSLRVQASGRAAHAGASHEKGANAVVQLSRAVDKLSAITDYHQNLTLNVGSFHGGTVPNRVPDFAESLVEMRAFAGAVLEKGLQRAMALDGFASVQSAVDGFAAATKITCYQHIQPWPDNHGSQKLAELFGRVGKSLGLHIASRARGGLSDGNFTFDIVPTIDGLGPAGGNAHCAKRSSDGQVDQEYVVPGTMVPCAMTAVLAIEKLAG